MNDGLQRALEVAKDELAGGLGDQWNPHHKAFEELCAAESASAAGDSSLAIKHLCHAYFYAGADMARRFDEDERAKQRRVAACNRHAGDRAAKTALWVWFLAHRNEFRSKAEAARHYVETKAPGYKFRTIERWLGEF